MSGACRPGRLALAIAVVSMAACDQLKQERTFVAPSQVTVAKLEIEGPLSIAPGSSAQFRATLVDSGARRDVTSEATWTFNGFGLVVSGTGLVTAEEAGIGTLGGAYRGSLGEREVSAVPSGTFVVRGTVSPVIPAAPGRVEVLDGAFAGMNATADVVGRYWLLGVSGPIRLRASVLGHTPQSREVTVTDHAEVSFALATSPAAPVAGRWRLAVSSSAQCAFRIRDASATIDIVDGFYPSDIFIEAPTSIGPVQFYGTLVWNVLSSDLRIHQEGASALGIDLSSPRAEVIGEALGVVAGDGITGTVNGLLIDRSTTPARQCQATDHAFVMTRH